MSMGLEFNDYVKNPAILYYSTLLLLLPAIMLSSIDFINVYMTHAPVLLLVLSL